MVHASFHQYNGFRGRAVDFINVLKQTVGPWTCNSDVKYR